MRPLRHCRRFAFLFVLLSQAIPDNYVLLKSFFLHPVSSQLWVKAHFLLQIAFGSLHFLLERAQQLLVIRSAEQLCEVRVVVVLTDWRLTE